MSGMRQTTRLLANLALAVLLVTAQAGVAAHAFEHDAGAPQAKTCSTCVTAAELGAASVSEPVPASLTPPSARYEAPVVFAHQSRFVLITRQRGPPTPL